MFKAGFGFIASRATLRVIAFVMPTCAFADAVTSVSATPTEKGTGSAPSVMNFSVVRGGNLGYDVKVDYHTVDGTAIGGIDYTGGSGSITMPAGAATATIPIPLAANTTSDADTTFPWIPSRTSSSPIATRMNFSYWRIDRGRRSFQAMPRRQRSFTITSSETDSSDLMSHSFESGVSAQRPL